MFGLKTDATNEQILGNIYADKLVELLRKNPAEGIRKIRPFYGEALDKSYEGKEISRGYAEALTGGPFEAIPWAVYNAVGLVYPELNREMKDLALIELLKIFDRYRYDIVQLSHTAGIREPLLLSDISIAEPFYWPGLDEGKEILKEYHDFPILKTALIDDNGLFFHSGVNWDFKEIVDEGRDTLKIARHRAVNSDFVVAYSLLRSDFCDYGEDYIGIANSAFLDRTLRGIVAMRFSEAETEDDIKKGKERLHQLLPKSLHERIEPMRLEDGWTSRKKFEHRF
jgi:hypothetical protein